MLRVHTRKRWEQYVAKRRPVRRFIGSGRGMRPNTFFIGTIQSASYRFAGEGVGRFCPDRQTRLGKAGEGFVGVDRQRGNH